MTAAYLAQAVLAGLTAATQLLRRVVVDYARVKSVVGVDSTGSVLETSTTTLTTMTPTTH